VYETLYIKSTVSHLKKNPRQSIQSRFQTQIHRPILTVLLRNRWQAQILVAVVILHLVFGVLDFEIWRCPVKTVTGIRCPGCGLSTAILYMVHGKLFKMLHEHAFAPFFSIGILIIAIISFLPERSYSAAVHRIALFEERSGFFSYFLAGFIVYWIIRLIANI
jgi:hypothetical protein